MGGAGVVMCVCGGGAAQHIACRLECMLVTDKHAEHAQAQHELLFTDVHAAAICCVVAWAQASELEKLFKALAADVKAGKVVVAQARKDLKFAAAAVKACPESIWHSATVKAAMQKAQEAVNAQLLAARHV